MILVVQKDFSYEPTFHEDPDFQPIFVEHFVPGENKSVVFNKLRSFLVNHLNYQYKEGKLMWPKKRSEIVAIFNELPRQHFPAGNELE